MHVILYIPSLSDVAKNCFEFYYTREKYTNYCLEYVRVYFGHNRRCLRVALLHKNYNS